ncbi:FKBP12-associated protein [Coemansia sp. RSA 2336]|nr:FKBP12-associated protein [Coemansia sp. RSA 2336]
MSPWKSIKWETQAKANLQAANNAVSKQQAKNEKAVPPESGNQPENSKQRRSANKPSRSQKHKAKVRDSDHRGRKGGKSRGMAGSGRTFNGSLTHDNDVSDSNGDGAASHSRTEPESQDLSSTLAKRLFNGSYECMICCDKVRPRHAIWHCDKCWAVFHIGCVKKWVKSCSGDPSNQWRCPGCQYGRAAEPTHYFCFCGAVRDPEPARGCTPHSCGQICGRNRGPHCTHPCPLPCHPGPCPPCTAMAPEQWCFCGRLSYQPRCGADYDPTTCIKSCGAICGDILGCGRHKCEEPCHSGLCPPCPHNEEQQCYCGRHTRTARCGAGHPQPTFVTQEVDGKEASIEQTGYYDCGEPCNQTLGCGIHQCERSCHPQPNPDTTSHGECLRDPKVVAACHCGKKLASSLGAERTNPAMCDESKPCETMVDVSCGCGRLTAQKICGATASNGHSTSKLACNEACKIAERNRRLALALNTNERDDTPLAGLVKASYSDDLLQFTRTHLSWVRDIESKAAAFIGEKNRLTLNFAPMKLPFRAFLHALGPFYGCRSRSVDYEPLRSVCWDRTGQATIPSISLSNAVQYTVVPQIVCSSCIHAKEDSDGEDSASVDLNDNVKSIPRNSAVDRLRRKVDFLVISDLRHGLVEEELQEAINQYIPSNAYIIRWMGEDRVEMYCKDVDVKYDHLQKWESVLKSKLPLHSVAGMVKGVLSASNMAATPAQQNNVDASVETTPKRSDAANSPSATFWNTLAVADLAADVSGCSVSED